MKAGNATWLFRAVEKGIPDDEIILTFGKYAGCSLEDVRNKDSDYIDWLQDCYIDGEKK